MKIQLSHVESSTHLALKQWVMTKLRVIKLNFFTLGAKDHTHALGYTIDFYKMVLFANL